MAQGSYVLPTVGVFSGLTEQGYINDALLAMASKSSGASAPTNGPSGAPVLGQDWLDTTTPTSVPWYVYDGSGWRLIGTFDISGGTFIPASLAGIGSIASAATVDLGSTTAPAVNITGSTGPITSFGSSPATGTIKTLYFSSTPTITNSSNIVNIGGDDIIVEAGDVAAVIHLGSGVWKMLYYARLSGYPVKSPFANMTESIKTGGYSVVAADRGKLLILNSTADATFSLPASTGAGIANTVFHAKSINTGRLTLDPNGSELIDDSQSFTIDKNQYVSYSNNGTKWRILDYYRGYPAGEVTLAASTGHVVVDSALGDSFLVSSSLAQTVGDFANGARNRRIELLLKNTSTAAVTWSLTTSSTVTGGSARFGSDITALTGIAAGKTDVVGLRYNFADSIWDVQAYIKGF